MLVRTDIRAIRRDNTMLIMKEQPYGDEL